MSEAQNANAGASHASFLAMLPAIRRQAQITFRKVPLELRHDLIQEVIANCFTAYARLVELGQENVAFPSPISLPQSWSGRLLVIIVLRVS